MWLKLKMILLLGAWVIGGLCASALVSCSDAHGDQQDRLAALAIERAERRAQAKAQSEEWREEWDRHERERDARWAKMEADAEEERRRLEEELAKNPPKKRVRRVRRFRWESPAETRGKLWNVPESESHEATLTAFLRICIAEADGHPQDCVGIWQVFKNIRRRSCSRDYVRRITECDEDGETMLSVMRRAQPHIMGVIKLRNKRAGWIRNLGPDCDPPEGWRHGENQWDAQYTNRCQHVVQLGRALIAGDSLPQRPGHRLKFLPHRPITWGGRCESGKAACDDQIACARGLNRIPDTDTHNAFWCRPGQRGCPDGIDPVCQQYRDTHVTSRETETIREPSS